MPTKIRPIALYLPQYHPIPENDEWWGKGFTEWTNTAKAKPLFKGHHQPNLPSELGFYDLRVSEVREQQAELARSHGIEGFMYWHYWFAGKRILERPFKEVLASGKPDFPFCLGWANETWSGIWHGMKDKILIEQTYPGKEDYENHFYEVLPAFKDKRYITVNGCPLFLIYKPREIPECEKFMLIWRELALKNGVKGIHFVGLSNNMGSETQEITKLGFDGVYLQRHFNANQAINRKPFNKLKHTLWKKGLYKRDTKYGVFKYKEIIERMHGPEDSQTTIYPMILPNWDNSPRSGKNSMIFQNSTPELFRKHVKQVLGAVKDKPEEHRIVLIKSWNEWAEGNYMEPDLQYGRQYLEVLKDELSKI